MVALKIVISRRRQCARSVHGNLHRGKSLINFQSTISAVKERAMVTAVFLTSPLQIANFQTLVWTLNLTFDLSIFLSAFRFYRVIHYLLDFRARIQLIQS